MQLLEASSEIDVPAARAWQVLADLASYADWNPFIVAAEGELRVGEHLKVTLRAPDRPAVTFRPRILALEPGHLITWKGQWLLPGLFDGRHTLHVEPLGDIVHGCARVAFVEEQLRRGFEHRLAFGFGVAAAVAWIALLRAIGKGPRQSILSLMLAAELLGATILVECLLTQ